MSELGSSLPDSKTVGDGRTVSERHLCMFSTPRFNDLNMRSPSEYCCFDWWSDEANMGGTFAGVLSSGTLEVGYSATFGGPDFFGTTTTLGITQAVESWLRRLDGERVDSIRVRLRPGYYGRDEVSTSFALLNSGFRVESCDYSLAIPLGGLQSSEEYATMLPKAARKALRHSFSEPFSSHLADSYEDWSAAYEVIRENRSSKGYSLALNLDYIFRLRNLFPDRVRFLILRYDELPVAAALIYTVLPGKDLVVYWGDSRHSLKRSPMNRLAYEVVSDSLARRSTLLDLGSSSLRGVPNQGLIQFKQSVGGVSDLKLTLLR